MSQHPDYRYIKGLLENDCKILKEAYIAFRPRAIDLVKKMGGNEEDGKDIFQKGLMAVLQNASKEGFELTCPFWGYMKRICHNLWIDEIRKKGNLKTKVWDDDEPEPDKDTEEKEEYELKYKLMEKCIEKLPDRYRELINLRIKEKKKFREIDELMSYSSGGARVAYHRYTKRLRGCVEGMEEK